MSTLGGAIDFKKTIQAFLDLREWEDVIEFNESSKEWYVGAGIDISEYSGRLFVEGQDSNGMLGVFFYFSTKCKDSKRDELIKLLNWANCFAPMGNFECLFDGSIRWKLKFDCENAGLTGLGLSQNVQHGWDITGIYADAIMAVALTKTSADEAIAEFNEML